MKPSEARLKAISLSEPKLREAFGILPHEDIDNVKVDYRVHVDPHIHADVHAFHLDPTRHWTEQNNPSSFTANTEAEAVLRSAYVCAFGNDPED